MANKDFPVMLAKNYDPKRIKDWSNIHIEPKHDGVRVLITVKKGSVLYQSRNGRALDMFGHIDEAAEVMLRGLIVEHPSFLWRGAVLDGEMCSLSKDFGDISGAIHRKNATVRHAIFRCFAAIPLQSFEYGLDGLCQEARMDMIYNVCEKKKLRDIVFTPPTKVSDNLDVQHYYARFQKDGHEGAMVKDLSKPWIAERSWAWMKMKAELALDLPIVGYKEGRGKYAGTLGALIVSNKGVEVPVSGMDDALRIQIWRSRKAYMGRTVEVTYQEETKRGSLRHPRFKRLRPDKD